MSDFFSKRIVLYIGIALMLIGVSGLVIDNNDSNDKQQTATTDVAETTVITSNADGTVVSYNGVEGRNALDLLKEGAEVVTEESTFGEYVTTINGVEQTNKKYWIFYINNEEASVGAGSYETKGEDTIEWRLEN